MSLLQESVEPYIASCEGEATFLVHKGHRLVVLIDDRRRPVFAFPNRNAGLLSDTAVFQSGAVVCARDFARSAAIVGKLVRASKQRHRAWEDRVAGGRSVAHMPPVVTPLPRPEVVSATRTEPPTAGDAPRTNEGAALPMLAVLGKPATSEVDARL